MSLKDLLGQWTVLYFYPKDDTPGCTTEACEFTTNWDQFQKLSARVIGVSPDSPESHQKFIAKHKLRIELLSDPEHEVLAKYGAWGEKNMYGKIIEGVLRTTVLIDPKGQDRPRLEQGQGRRPRRGRCRQTGRDSKGKGMNSDLQTHAIRRTSSNWIWCKRR